MVYAASFIEWFADEARRIYGESRPPWATAASSLSSAVRVNL
jgi:hypothetical protein